MMNKPVLCDGKCGRILDFETSSKEIYSVNGKYFCKECAGKLPKYIMKKCCQCKYFGIDKEGYSYCDVDFIRYINPRDEACKDYKCKEFINI